MSQFSIWAKLCAGKNIIGPSIQAQGAGGFMAHDHSWCILLTCYAQYLTKRERNKQAVCTKSGHEPFYVSETAKLWLLRNLADGRQKLYTCKCGNSRREPKYFIENT